MDEENITKGLAEITQLAEKLHRAKTSEMRVFSFVAIIISLAAAYLSGLLAFFICTSVFWSAYFILARQWSLGIEAWRIDMVNTFYVREQLLTRSPSDTE